MVNFEGEDGYLSHVDRLKIPITFIHGEENETFLLESTRKTLALLREKNGKSLYKRHVIPDYGQHRLHIRKKCCPRRLSPYFEPA